MAKTSMKGAPLMKKLISAISFVLVLVMLTSGATVFGAKAKFKDFDYSPQCGWDGYPDGTFHPDEKVTRAELVCLVYKYHQSLKDSSMESYIDSEPKPTRQYDGRFRDVPKKSWYYTAVAWAYSYGIIEGTSKTKFMPESEIGLFEYAIIWYRYYTKVMDKCEWEFRGFFSDECFVCHTSLENPSRFGNYDFNSWENSYYAENNEYILVKIPKWFLKEAKLDDVLHWDIWMGGTYHQVDMTDFSSSRGELYKHSLRHFIFDDHVIGS